MNKQLKILVVGGDGFIGTSLCQCFRSYGHKVTSFDIKNGDDARFGNLDVESYDWIYFLAWDVGGAKYLYDQNTQLMQLEWNLALLINVIPQLKTVPFVFVSSRLACNCDLVYGILKHLGEIWVSLLEHGVSLRLYNPYGSFENQTNKSHVVADFIYQALLTGEIRMMTTGREERQFLYISDVHEAFKLALDNKVHGTYDVTSGDWIPVIYVAELLQKHTGCKIIIGTKDGVNMRNGIEIQSLPSWTPKINIEDGIVLTLETYKTAIETNAKS